MNKNHCRALSNTTRLTGLPFADDVIICAVTVCFSAGSWHCMTRQSLWDFMSPGPRSSYMLFGGLLDEVVLSAPACGFVESFFYLGSVVHSSGGSCQEILGRLACPTLL